MKTHSRRSAGFVSPYFLYVILFLVLGGILFISRTESRRELEAGRQNVVEVCTALQYYHNAHGRYPVAMLTLQAAKDTLNPHVALLDTMRFREESWSYICGDQGASYLLLVQISNRYRTWFQVTPKQVLQLNRR